MESDVYYPAIGIVEISNLIAVYAGGKVLCVLKMTISNMAINYRARE